MRFADGIVNSYKKKWSFMNSFRVNFNFTDTLKNVSGWRDDTHGRDITLNIINITTPQFTNQPIEVFVANKWVIGNGRDELYRFSITFRDYNQMELYSMFLKMYQRTKNDYPSNVMLSINLYKDADYFSEEELKLFTFEETMIEAVSQLTFDNTAENQIAEFSVQFKSTTPLLLQ